MQIIHTQDNTYTLFFKRGEYIVTKLNEFLSEKGIQAAHITGLGAADEIDVAYYNIGTKKYERHSIVEEVEILGLTGNVGVKEDGDMVIHLHGSFGRKDLSAFGGHIFDMRISGAGEIHLRAFDGVINRAYDEETGLFLMCQATTE